jgi:hypothetical protein
MKMEWQVILALVLIVPVLLIPVVLIWYINFGGISVALKEAREKRAARKPVAKEISVQQ